MLLFLLWTKYSLLFLFCFFFFFNDTATTEIYTSVHTLSLHDALRSPPSWSCVFPPRGPSARRRTLGGRRAGQHGAEVQTRTDHARGRPVPDGRGAQARRPGRPGPRRKHLRHPRRDPPGHHRDRVRSGAQRGTDPRGVPEARPRDESPSAPEVRRGSRRHPEDREEGGGMARAPRTARQGRARNRPARGGLAHPASKAKRLKRIGIVDTSFSRYDMASAAIDELRKQGEGFTVERYTVPGI